MSLTGRCLCGAVRYELEGEPRAVFLCHCRDCQRSGGSLVHYGLMFGEGQVKCEGELRSFASKADSGRTVVREFCPTCGSGISNRLEMAPGFVVIKGGTLDAPATLPPTLEVYTYNKAPFLSTPDSLARFEHAPPVKPAG